MAGQVDNELVEFLARLKGMPPFSDNPAKIAELEALRSAYQARPDYQRIAVELVRLSGSTFQFDFLLLNTSQRLQNVLRSATMPAQARPAAPPAGTAPQLQQQQQQLAATQYPRPMGAQQFLGQAPGGGPAAPAGFTMPHQPLSQTSASSFLFAGATSAGLAPPAGILGGGVPLFKPAGAAAGAAAPAAAAAAKPKAPAGQRKASGTAAGPVPKKLKTEDGGGLLSPDGAAAGGRKGGRGGGGGDDDEDDDLGSLRQMGIEVEAGAMLRRNVELLAGGQQYAEEPVLGEAAATRRIVDVVRRSGLRSVAPDVLPFLATAVDAHLSALLQTVARCAAQRLDDYSKSLPGMQRIYDVRPGIIQLKRNEEQEDRAEREREQQELLKRGESRSKQPEGIADKVKQAKQQARQSAQVNLTTQAIAEAFGGSKAKKLAGPSGAAPVAAAAAVVAAAPAGGAKPPGGGGGGGDRFDLKASMRSVKAGAKPSLKPLAPKPGSAVAPGARLLGAPGAAAAPPLTIPAPGGAATAAGGAAAAAAGGGAGAAGDDAMDIDGVSAAAVQPSGQQDGQRPAGAGGPRSGGAAPAAAAAGAATGGGGESKKNVAVRDLLTVLESHSVYAKQPSVQVMHTQWQIKHAASQPK